MTMQKRPFENIVGEGANAGNNFYPSKNKHLHLVGTCKCFEVQNFPFGKELNTAQSIIEILYCKSRVQRISEILLVCLPFCTHSSVRQRRIIHLP